MKPILFLLLFGIACAQVSNNQRMTDRELDSFIGPVKKVFVEWSPISRSWSNIPIGTRCRDMTKVYDKSGRLTQYSVYPGSCGSDEIREDYTYNQDGSRTSKTQEIRDKNSPEPPPPIAGPPLNSEDMGQPRTFFKYDSKGRLIEEKSVRPSGKVISRNGFRYDARDRLIEIAGYDGRDQLSVRRVYDFTGEERVPTGFVYYGGNGKIYERTSYTEYEFNSRGDWIKRKETTEETFNRKSVSSIRREIEYYSPNK